MLRRSPAYLFAIGLLAVVVGVLIGATIPRPDHAESREAATFGLEAQRYRLLTLTDRNGAMPADAYMRAKGHVDRMKVAAARRQRMAPSATAAAAVERNAWRWLGPSRTGGRLRAIAIRRDEPNTMFIGSAGGGIWKTTDGGASWAPVDDFLPVLSVSSLAIDPLNPAVMYAGTGETAFVTSLTTIGGAGIFKSTDGGTTWTQLPATAQFSIGRVAIAPNGQVLLAARPFGIFRSTNGGATFSFIQLNRNIQDVDFHPTDSNRAVAAGNGIAAYSNDAGATWQTASGLPIGSSRAEIAYARGSPNVVYVSLNHNAGALFRSNDGGVTYSAVRLSGLLQAQGEYNNALWVDPIDANHVIVGGVELSESFDGGVTWRPLFIAVHVDHHAIVEHPAYGTGNWTVFFGNDGGIAKMVDVRTANTTQAVHLNNGLGITQFYSGAGHPSTGLVVGGTQDNGSLRWTESQGTIWTRTLGGDGGVTAIDPVDPQYVYSAGTQLSIHRSTTGGTNPQPIYSGIQETVGANFIAPYILDPNDPSRMLAGGSQLWRTNDVKAESPAWSAITPGGFGSDFISAIAVAPGRPDEIWIGRNSGRVYRTVNGTAAVPGWTQVNVPPQARVARIAIHPANPNVVYVTSGGFSVTTIVKTVDGGATWTDATGPSDSGLPTAPVHDLEIDPLSPDTIIAATEVGVFVSPDGGATWNLPHDGPANVNVFDLFWMDRTLVAATHGRGMFAVDVDGGSQPAIAVSPSPLAFGSREINTTDTRSLTVTNTGGAPLTVGAVSLSGSHAADFSVAQSTCSEASLGPGAACSIQIAFRPSAAGSRSATLSIASNAPTSPTAVPLTGTGTAPTADAPTIVLWTANIPAANLRGNWTRISDAAAAGGAALWNRNGNLAKVAPALASPAHFFETTFEARAGTAYHVWIRLRAEGESKSNDSVHLQFSDSVTEAGAAAMRIGTTSSAEFVLQGGPADGSAHHGWGWTENGWGALGPHVYFAADGSHTVRVQQREDGAVVDQIVLSPVTYLTSAPGPRDSDTTILPATNDEDPPTPGDTIVLWPGQTTASQRHGRWEVLQDAAAAGGVALWNRNLNEAKVAPPLAAPANYFEMTFTAAAGRAYHIWIRLRAEGDSKSNDSVHLQFSDSVTESGSATMRIGTATSAEFVLQGGPADTSAHHVWGWTENGWESFGAHVYFAGSGTHTVRVQQREDGAIVDQIVLSPSTYLTSPPGARDADATILPATGGGQPAPAGTVVLHPGVVPAAQLHGRWEVLADATAAGGSALWNRNLNSAKVAPALASPTSYFEMTFTAGASRAYHVWVRLRAKGDANANDSVHVQFSDSVDASGVPIMRIGTTASGEFVLQNGPSDASGNHSWGWTENGWGSLGAHVYFAASGTHTIRIQQREDGAIIDQVVISPDVYLTTAPGPRDGDTTILPPRSGS